MTPDKTASTITVPHPKGRWSEHEATVILEAWRRSGSKLSVFARTHGLALPTLYRWRARLQPAHGGSSPTAMKSPSFLPMTMCASTAPAPMDEAATAVVHIGDVRIELRDLTSGSSRWLAALAHSMRCGGG